MLFSDDQMAETQMTSFEYFLESIQYDSDKVQEAIDWVETHLANTGFDVVDQYGQAVVGILEYFRDNPESVGHLRNLIESRNGQGE